MTKIHGDEPAQLGLMRLLILTTIGLASGLGPAWSWSEGDIAPIAQIILEAEVAPRPMPGATAAITFRNGVHWSGAAGSADQQGNKPISVLDQMRIGSQTKTYTGTVILQMIQEDKISLDDTLAKWLPNSGVPQADKITIRNLLDMTSGIPDYLSAPSAALSGSCPPVPAPPATLPSVIDEWVRLRGLMKTPPSALVTASSCLPSTGLGRMAYSNTNFVLLGMIAEKIGCGNSPQPNCYVDELQRRVLSRIPGLHGTAFPTDADFPHPPFSGGYARIVAGVPVTGMGSLVNPDANAYETFTRVEPPVPWTAGAMISSADDETIWASQLADNRFKLLSPEMQKKRLTELVPGNVAGLPARYGLAIYYMKSMLNNVDMLGHSGSIVGYTSNVSRRPDNGTDYSANVSTFFLSDQFTAPALVWILDRGVWGAIKSTGNCGSAAPTTCTGDSVRLSPLSVAHALTLQPSNKSYDTYAPAPPDPLHPNETPIVSRKTPVPTVAFYGHRQSALALGGSATLTIQPQATLAMVGNQSTAIGLTGSKNSVSVGGSVTAAGRDVAGLRDAGSSNTMTVTGQISGSVVWWNPDLPFYGTPSTQVVAVPEDSSATVDLAGSAGKLAIKGLVQTQRIKTAAMQLRPEASGYQLSIDSQGAVIGPITLAGTKTSLSIAQGGLGLYVMESRLLIPQPRVSTTAARQLNVALRNRLPVTATNEYVPIGAPGMPPVPRRGPTNRMLGGTDSNSTLSKSEANTAPPPAMLALLGSDNVVTIEGTLVGAIPKDFQTDYTQNVVAVDQQGSGNAVNIRPTGKVIGDIIVHGQGARLRIDGAVKGNITVTEASTVLEGSGTIDGKLTVNGTPTTQHGALKFGRVP
jgi:CubicO group peptidase (beta-lactamase class C family)